LSNVWLYRILGEGTIGDARLKEAQAKHSSGGDKGATFCALFDSL